MLSLALCSGPAGGNCGALGLKRHSPGKRTGRNHASARDVWVGSHPEELALKRGRNDHCSPPPAQIRAGGIPAHGSYLGCMTAKRLSGYG